MPGTSQPLDQKFAIVDAQGRPTDYFTRWAQQKQIDIGDSITLGDLETFLTEHALQEGSGIQFTPDGDMNNSPTVAADVQEILDQISASRGTILYRGLLGWSALLPGTPGFFLKTNGAGADPSWAMGGGGGSVGFEDINIGVNASAFSANFFGGRPIYFPTPTTINAVKLFGRAAAPAANISPAIYSANAAGTLNALLASGPTVVGLTTGVNTLPLTTPLAVAAGTWLWVGLVNTGAAITLGASAGPASANFAQSSHPAPAIPGVTTYGTFNWSSMWAE